MKRHQLFKTASDFAFETIDQNDLAALDVAVANKFKDLGYDSADYVVWKQYFAQARGQFVQLKTQNAPSVKPAAPAARIPEAHKL